MREASPHLGRDVPGALPSIGHEATLDSIRGLAALAVVMTHAIAFYSIDGIRAFWTQPLDTLPASGLALVATSAVFNASGAVVLFFCLSGFVLSLSLTKTEGQPAPLPYFAKRFFRLFPPMWVSILLMWMTTNIIPAGDVLRFSLWFEAVYREISWLEVAKNFLLVETSANPVTWTMYVEVVGSVYIFGSMMLFRRWGKAALYLNLGTTLLISIALYPSLTFGYLFCFQLGASLALERPIIRLPGNTLLAIGFSLFVFQRLSLDGGIVGLLCNTMASGAVLMGVTRNGARDLLQHKPLIHLGRVSYSLYLFHLPVLYVVGVLVSSKSPSLSTILMLLSMAIPISFLLAFVAYSLFEEPSNKVGRRLAIYLSHRKIS